MRIGEFLGSERFDVISRLGGGGMGDVYRVFDRELQAEVALKTLKYPDANSLLRFKREFRELCDVSHHNLVALYELLVSRAHWVFTMELVEGADLLAHLRADPAPGAYYRVFRQLAEAVGFLHEKGKLHRDIKPSNVLVTGEGRVVVLDFGLVTALGARAAPSPKDYLVGTFGYLAPETIYAGDVSPAADWYSVGAVLHEALTGVAPEPQAYDPPPPAGPMAEQAPELAALCASLLARDPRRRPRSDEILGRLGARRTGRPRGHTPFDQRPFVGRAAALNALEDALAESQQGKPRVVLLHGSSGIGKTTLVEEFARRAHGADAIVLDARCYERETVPLKTLDVLVDSLTEHLYGLERGELQPLLPEDIHALAHLFPVLRRLGAVSAQAHTRELRDPQERRHRGLAALRDLLRGLRERHPVVLVLDDFQWSDVESAALLLELLGSPEPPGVLLLLCYRSDGAPPGRAVEILSRSSLSPVDLPVEAMSPEEARQLALAWLGEEQPDAIGQADAIARESQGSPFFVDEFVRYLRLMRRTSVDGASLDEVLRTRISRLPEEARRVLQVAAVAGYPIAQSLAVRAAGVGQGATALGILRADHMVRTNGTRSEDTLVTYHDRIRTAVVASLPAEERQAIHRRIAELLQTRTGLDSEALTHHLTSAGQPEAAAIHAVKAGDRASDHLQFDRAVHFYRMALELGRHEKTDELAIRRKLADALANAGLGAAAAEEYLQAAAGLTGEERGRLRLRAAEQLIRCGHSGRGLDTIGEHFREVGVWLPRRRPIVLLDLLYQRLRVWLSRYRAGRQPVEAPDVCQLIDVFYSLGFALSFSDTMRGLAFQAQGLRLSLAIGEPHRISRGLAAEALLAGSRGGDSDRSAHVERMLGARRRLGIEDEEDPLLGGYVLGATCGVAYLNGRWRRSLELADQAEELLRERCTGVWWELAQLQVVAISCLYWVGDIHEVCRRTFSCLQDARAKGDLFKASSVRGALSNFAWLALDDAAEARQHAEQARAEWGEEFDLQHSFNVFAQGQIDLYQGRGGAALERVRASWARQRRALLLTLQMNYLNLIHLRARAALMEAVAGPQPDRRLLAAARRDARRMHGTGMAWARPLAHLVEAGVAAASGQPEAALAALTIAESGLVAEDMALYAAVARLRRGELVGGAEGERQLAAAVEELRVCGVSDPEKVALMCAPGFGR